MTAVSGQVDRVNWFEMICCLCLVDQLSIDRVLKLMASKLVQPNDAVLTVPEIITHVTSLFDQPASNHTVKPGVSLTTDLTLNWLLNVFDQ
jgi:EF hand